MGKLSRLKTEQNRLRRLTKGQLNESRNVDQAAFDRWHSQIKNSKHSHQRDIPSSQLQAKMSVVFNHTAQLFVVIDTCTLCSFRVEFMDHVTNLRRVFPSKMCPIRFIISLPVLEELDRCNRKTKKPQQTLRQIAEQVLNNQQTAGSSCEAGDKNNNLGDLTAAMRISSDPPRSFMRFLEEEIRTSEIIISDMDPFKRTSLGEIGQNLEIINSDDRILECCLRSQAFVAAQNPHPDSNVILVTEDNVFKSKATTFGIVSYRWIEFRHKYKNFGLNHYVSTPRPDPIPRIDRHSLSSPRPIQMSKNETRRSLAIRMKPEVKKKKNMRNKPKLSISDDGDSDDDVEIISELITVE